jgi:RNA polymerase sigma-70 factor (sigma-E family)
MSPMSSGRDAEFSDYMSARLPALRRLARLLCQDWTKADDLLQAAMTKAYVHWSKAARAENTDAYVRAIVVREFASERRASWAQRVNLTGQPPDRAIAAPDHDCILDLRAAVAALPPRQRAVLVLRYYCDLNVSQAAQALDCTPGTVKSQTAKALNTLRRLIGADYDPASQARPDRTAGQAGEVHERA